MYSYIIGKIISINKKTITFENNYFGYVINVSNPEKFEINKIKKIYLYKKLSIGNKNNISEELYGFETHEEKQMFLSFLQISGVGPKTAISILKNDISIIKTCLLKQDFESLCLLENITPKIARLLIDNLSNSFNKEEPNENVNISELNRALKSLGYDEEEILFAIKNIDTKKESIDLSDLISCAIKNIALSKCQNVKTN